MKIFRPLLWIVLFLLYLLLPVYAVGQENPFLSPGQPKNADPQRESPRDKRLAAAQKNTLFTNSALFQRISAAQKRIQSAITDIMLPEEGVSPANGWFILLGGAFLYGFLHALGPGHRKVVLASYFLGEESAAGKGVLTAFSIGLLHGGSALVIIFGLFYIASGPVLQGFNTLSGRVDILAYLLLIFFGCALFLGRLFERLKNSSSKIEHIPIEQPHPRKRKNRRLSRLGFIVISGLVPCPGAAVLLILSLSAGAPWKGAAAIISMSLGMGLLLALVAVITILSKKGLMKTIPAGRRSFGYTLETVLELTGSAGMVLFGLFMMLPYLF